MRGEDSYEALAAALQLPAAANFARFDPLNLTYSREFHRATLAPLERQGIDFWWLDWQQGEHFFASSLP